jgi:peptidoglycan hydrolase-like protein with peptidoglycan-binding domain
MFCKARTRLALFVVAIAVALLGTPAAGFAASDSPDLLAPGAGYGSPEGSQPVRDLQRLLRRLGDAPGPIDGLYGRLTAGAVRRFQEAHALVVDGVVGPQTRGRLSAQRRKLRNARLERKSPARITRAESVTEQRPARSAGSAQPNSPHPERGESDSSTELAFRVAVAVGALALVLVVVVLWRLVGRGPRPQRTRTGPRLGLVGAALLAAYVIGAATGALFASYAAPDGNAKPSTAAAELRAR